MTPTLAGLIAGASALWRRERKLLAPLAGVFFFLPMFGTVLLLSRVPIPADASAEQLQALLTAFYESNLLLILLINLVLDFGTFAVLNLFLQGEGRTLGGVLGLTLRRFALFLVIDVTAGMLFGLGASLFLFPGLFAFARTWLAAPAFAAEPQIGPFGAFVSGWKLSGGMVWLLLLGAAGIVFLFAIFLGMTAALLLGMLGGALGDTRIVSVVAMFAWALIGSAAWTALALIRVVAYRATRQGI